jgi:hypothetical protein
MTELQDLGWAWEDDVVQQAFWLQAAIHQRGQEGINFSGAVVTTWSKAGEPVVEDRVKQTLKKDGFNVK